MASPKSILRVSGLMFNYTDYINFGELAENSKLIIEQNSEKIPYADRLGAKTVFTGRNFKIEGAMRQPTGLWLARLTGGSVATGGQFYYRETVTRATNDYVLTHGTGGTEGMLAIVRVYDRANNTERKKVASSPVANESYTLSGKTLTVNASDSSATLEVTYIYTDSATADGKIIVPSQTMPSVCRMLLSVQLDQPDTQTINRLVIDCAKCYPTGNLEIGGNAQQLASIPVAFDVVNASDGDVVIYMNGYAPGF